ncbi:MAG TPA: FliH/SctL family protein [Planctomicrobium sp.]|nr:FliH/SctL family protein [Planctomicrobium sp.]
MVDIAPPKPAPVVTPVQFRQESPRPTVTEPDLTPLLGAITASISEVEERRQQSLGELQHVAIELAIAVASQVVYQSIERGEFAVEELVSRAIHEMGIGSAMTIFLNPADLTLLHKRLATLTPSWNLDQVELKADTGIARGGCRAELPEGRLLVSEVTTRLSEIRRHWMEELDDAQIERRRAAGESPPLRRFPDRREIA